MTIGFAESQDKKKILCTVCERYGFKDWIGRDGDKKHLSSKDHSRNVDADRIRTAALAAIHNENQAINSALARLEIPVVQDPVNQTVYVPSAEEEQMWDLYHMEGANFSAGDNPAADDIIKEARLVRQADEFGRWNSTSIAQNLGFLAPEGEVEILDERDEEDAILCEMMDNARRFFISQCTECQLNLSCNRSPGCSHR